MEEQSEKKKRQDELTIGELMAPSQTVVEVPGSLEPEMEGGVSAGWGNAQKLG